MFIFFRWRAAGLAAASLPFTLAAAAPLTLDTALAAAVQHSEATRAARAGVRSASEAAQTAGRWSDPLLRAGVDNLPVTGRDRLSTTRDSMTMKRIGVSQEWLSAEKRAARTAAADAMVSRETVAVRVAAAETRLQTARAYIDAYFTRELLRSTTLMEHHLHEEFEAARGRLASSTGSSQEVLALAGARGIAEDESAQLRQQQASADVALLRWTGLPYDELSPVTGLVAVSEDAFVANHPRVVASQRDTLVAEKTAAVAASERHPNWTWELSYGQRTGYSDMVSFGVSIPLPVAREQRQDRELASKLALVDQADAELAEATRAAAAEYLTLSQEVDRLRQRIERVQSGVVTPAEQRTAAALAAYRSNQAPLATLFEARHAEVDAQRKLLSLQRELATAEAELSLRPLSLGDAP